LGVLLLLWRNNDGGNGLPSSSDEFAAAENQPPKRSGKKTDRPMRNPFDPAATKTAQMNSMMQRITASLPLTDAEKQLVDAAVSRKLEARTGLEERRSVLAEMVVSTLWNDEQLLSAIDDVLILKERVKKQVDEIDNELVASVSPRARALLYATGIVDNGLPLLLQIKF